MASTSRKRTRAITTNRNPSSQRAESAPTEAEFTHGGERFHLSRDDRQFLHLLLEHQGQITSRWSLLQSAGGGDADVRDARAKAENEPGIAYKSLPDRAKRIRAAIRKTATWTPQSCPEPIIQGVRDSGYRLICTHLAIRTSRLEGPAPDGPGAVDADLSRTSGAADVGAPYREPVSHGPAELETAVRQEITRSLEHVARHWWSQINTALGACRASASTPDQPLTPAADVLELEPAEGKGTLVLDAEGRALALLREDCLQISWVNRYTGEVYKWPSLPIDRDPDARLLAIAMEGPAGVRIVMSTASQTLLLHAGRPPRGDGEWLRVETVSQGASRDAVFVGYHVVTISTNGQAPQDQTGLTAKFGLRSIDCIDAAVTGADGLFAAVGRTPDETLNLVMIPRVGTTMGDRKAVSLKEQPDGIVVVRGLTCPSHVFMYYRNGALERVDYDGEWNRPDGAY